MDYSDRFWTLSDKYKNGVMITEEQRKHYRELCRLGLEDESIKYWNQCERENRNDDYQAYIDSGEAAYSG